ncbi:MAG: glycosyltransferase family 2 protein [Candidatus Marithrix sp.]
MQKISFVVPVYNEEKNIPLLYLKIVNLMTKFKEEWELIFINDGSNDKTIEILAKHSIQDKRVKYINLSRNFGHQAALTAGLDNVSSNTVAIISLDCDLQDPPEIIEEMINKWKSGYNIVYARRKSRKDNFIKKYTAILYYKLLDKFSDIKIPRNVGDFRLIDVIVLEHLKGMREKARYLRGMVAWLGFKYAFVDFNRPERIHGNTGYTFKKMLKLAMDGLLNFSFLPLRIGLFLGILSITLGILITIYMFFDITINNVYYPLYKWLVVFLFIFIGFQFMLLWILGEYIGRIYDESKQRPLYVIKEKTNFE